MTSKVPRLMIGPWVGDSDSPGGDDSRVLDCSCLFRACVPAFEVFPSGRLTM